MLTDEVLLMAFLLEFDLRASALPPWFPQLLLDLGHQVDAFPLVDGVSAELKWLSFGSEDVNFSVVSWNILAFLAFDLLLWLHRCWIIS